MLNKFCKDHFECEVEEKTSPFSFSAKPQPWDFVRSQTNPRTHKPLFNLAKGTTTLAFRFKEGIIVAVDSRASMGSFVSSESVRKVIPINDRILGTMAGGAADCSYWEEYLGYEIKLYELNSGEKLSVAGASKMFSNILYEYRGYGLSIGSMIAGSDDTGVHLYYCDNEGNRIKGDRFAVGSGGTYAYGVLDTYYKYDLSLKEAIDLGKRAISEATFMDSGSGGVVRIYYVFQGGWRCLVDAQDNNELVWEHRRAHNVL